MPGSHRLPGQPTQLLSARFAGGSVEGVGGHDQTDVLRLDRMPNLLRVAPIPAGSYVMFDNAAWHTAFPNTLPPEIADAMPNHGRYETNTVFFLSAVFLNQNDHSICQDDPLRTNRKKTQETTTVIHRRSVRSDSLLH